MAEQRVRLQNLRDFTVQIRHPTDDVIVGTGIAVATAGQVVTCAHVVEAALGVHPRNADGAEVGVYFPQARGGEEKARRATIAGCFQRHDDDVVLLQLADGPAPLAPDQIAVLGRAEESCYHPFRSYGYRSLENYIAGHAHGMILDCVEPPVDRNVQTEPVQLESQQVNRGMSGAGVQDAYAHYDEALKIARSITYRPALIEALLARGRWAARCAVLQTSGVSQTPEVLTSSAFSDLNEALGYAVDGGYCIYEADVRVALAWAHLAAGDPERARQEAERAQQMSVQMGYHWGQVDAAEALAAVEESATN